jgi:hypothetical protein
MTDLERRLCAALHAAAEPAPPGLMEAIMRRHRRHRIRLRASVLAVAAAATLAVPPVTSALHGVAGRGAGPGPFTGSHSSPVPGQQPSRPSAAPGTVLSGCNNANLGAIGLHWRAGAVHEAGPLWLIGGGHSSGRSAPARIRLYVAIVVLDRLTPGSVVVVRVAPTDRHNLRFLYGPSDSMTPQTPHLKHPMRRGETGVTFVACSRPNTNYYGGYFVRGARCVPVLVWVPGRARPIHIGLGACPGH